MADVVDIKQHIDQRPILGMGGLSWDFRTVLGMLAVPAILAAAAILSSRRTHAGTLSQPAH